MPSSSSPTQDDDTSIVDMDDDVMEFERSQPTGSKRKRATKDKLSQTQPVNEGKEWASCWTSYEVIMYITEDNDFVRKCGKCKYCGKIIKADSKLNGTSGLKKHAAICNKHPDVIAKKKQPNLVLKKNDISGEASVKYWKHDENEIKKALLDFFVCAEVPFKLVEHWSFVRFVNSLNDKFKLPSRHKLSKDISNYYLDERKKLYAYLSNPNNTVHLTTDTWTSSCQRENYMVVTAHFIDEDWVMHKKIINFRPIDSHKGDDIGIELMECIRGWGIKNVMTMTLDNASSNDKAISFVLSKLENKYQDGKHFHIRCMPHIVNIIVKDGLSHEILHLGIIEKSVKYIRKSTQRIKMFKECMKEANVESSKFLCGDCPTRWNSTYELLKRSVELKDIFFKYEEVDRNFVRDLTRVPGHEDFGAAKKMVKFLEKFKNTTVSVSASTKPLAHLFFGEVLDLDDHLREWECDPDFCLMVSSMRKKYDKYWGKLDELNDYMYFAVLLDPTMKKVFMRHCFRSIVLNNMGNGSPLSKVLVEKKVGDMMVDVETRMESLFKKYEESFDKSGQNLSSQEANTRNNVVKIPEKNSFVSKWRSVEEDTSSFESETELSRYLSEPKLNWSPSFDILKWWKQNEDRFPIVARMARDILAIQISSVASESAFSSSGRVLDPYRTRLSTHIVEALICTQDWVKNSSIPIFEDELNDILKDDDIAIEMEEAIKKHNKRGKVTLED